MEKKKINSTSKKTSTKSSKKPTTKKKKVNKKKRSKAFTLIELLAVIIILGILMIIAIPSVTTYINNSRKSAYVNTARELISGTRSLVNQGNLRMYDTKSTYYIPSSCIKTENETESPYGKFAQAYIGVIYNGTGYNYYWVSVDETGQGIKDITPVDSLDEKLIETDLNPGEIYEKTMNTGIEGRKKVQVLQDDCKTWELKTTNASYNVGENSTNEPNNGSDAIVYPTGKTKDTVVTGDIVTIGTEEFYVVKHDGDDLVLLAHYNLKVGNIYNSSGTKTGEYTSSDDGYGRQNSNAKGYISGASSYNGTVAFSVAPKNNYWNGKVGTNYPGDYCISESKTNCAYVYDSNSAIYQYINSYKNYLQGQGVTIKEARLMSLEESNAFRIEKPSAWKETSYWLGTTRSIFLIWFAYSDDYFGTDYFSNEGTLGIRPVIVI